MISLGYLGYLGFLGLLGLRNPKLYALYGNIHYPTLARFGLLTREPS